MVVKTKTISTCLLNVRSAQNKPCLIADFIVENEMDVLALTETWLKETDLTQSDTVSEMTPSGYRCLHVPRSRGKGGGVGILFRSCVSVKQASPSTFKTFENIHVSLKAGSSHFNIYVTYRPPPNNKNGLTVDDFLGSLPRCSKIPCNNLEILWSWETSTFTGTIPQIVTHANSVTSSTQMA